MSYPSYPEYQDSGIDWLGIVPDGWQINRLKDGGSLVSGIGFPHDFQGLEREEYQFYKVGDLESSSDGKYMSGAANTISATTLKILRARSIPAGSILWAKIGAALLLNRRRISTVKCCIDNNMTAYVPNSESIVSDWAYYWTSILDFGQVANPGAVPSLGEGYQEILPLLVPPRSEQTQIARFLDHQTARIDALIAEQQRLIELLKEKRQAVISHAVTKGLDPDVAMKDSGVEWLGEVPTHWSVTRLKFVSRIVDCKNRTPEFFDDGEYLVVRTSNVKNQVLNTNGAYYTNEENFRTWTLRGVPPEGSILFTREAPAGEVCLVPEGLPLCLGQRMMNIIPDDLRHTSFIFDFLTSDCLTRYIESVSHGSTVSHLRVEQVYDIPLLIPPLNEQAAIDEKVSVLKTQFRSLIDEAEKNIKLLNERRSALISAAVTGKIDVRDWQPPSSETFSGAPVSEGATV